MVQLILDYAYGIVVLILGMYAYAFVLGTVIPKYFLVLEYKGGVNGRGLRKFTFPGGRAVTYEPHPAQRRFIPTYALIFKDGFKYLKIKASPSVYFLNYDVVAFDTVGRVLDIINVKEHISKNESAKSVIIPEDTSYVSLILYKVNGRVFEKKPPYRLNPFKKWIYMLTVIASTFAATYVMVSNINMVLDLVYEYVKLEFDLYIGFAETAIIAFLVSLILISVTLRGNKRRALR